MKKIILMASVILLIVSCQKQKTPAEIGNSKTTNSSTLPNNLEKDITNITNNYFATLEPHTGAAKPPKWIGVVLADLAGAYMGATMGGSMGGDVGAASGGIAVGALASIVVGKLDGHIPNGGGTVLTANINNPYDFTGRIHYDIITRVYANPNLIYVNNQLDCNLYRDLAFNRMRENNFNADQYKTLFSTSFYCNNTNPLGNQSIIDFINASTIADSTEKSILVSYSTALMNTTQSSGFPAYSIQIENSIVSSSLPLQSKTLLLTYMSTARHGVAFWN
ncbi:MAG: hypothetical protein H0W73_18675 [Bacteroidetes bacterium]|nr:hypothetical protein [Bacteroidota bacterium]